tara:strand:- start:24771 stop:25673 length:903 start_codon:yes stop_codon:yes gene_type:complete
MCGGDSYATIYSTRLAGDALSTYFEEVFAPRGGLDKGLLGDTNFVLCRCSECSGLFQLHIPGSELLQEIYNPNLSADVIERKKRGKADPAARYRHAAEIISLLSLFPKAGQGLSVLDYGVGWGHWAVMAKAFGFKVFGTELDKDRANFARQNGIEIIDDEDIPNHAFDLINTEQVFEHLPKPLETLRHLSRGLSEDGIIKVSVPNSHGVERSLSAPEWRKVNEHLNPVAPLEHINCFKRKSLTLMAQRVGLTERPLPVIAQYRSIQFSMPLQHLIREFLVPINRNILKRSNYVLLSASRR